MAQKCRKSLKLGVLQITVFGCFCAYLGVRAEEQPWFQIVDGKPLYTRSYTAGLSANYGVVGKDGLVWYAPFDGNLKSQGRNPDKPEEILTVEGNFGYRGKAPAEGPQFVPGIHGQAFLSPPPTDSDMQVMAHAEFPGLDKITAASRGTLLFWMYTKDAGMWDRSNNFFWSGGFYMNIWWHGQMGVFPLQHYMNGQVVMDVTSDLKGWNLYGVTWAPGALRIYANGQLIDQTTHTLTGFPMVGFGTGGGMKPRVYDEAMIFNRILSPGEQRELYLAALRPASMPLLSAPSVPAPVTVDGRIEEAEWKTAAQVTGFLEGSPTGDAGSGQVADPVNEAWVQYDATNLYVAMRSPWPAPILAQRVMTTGLSGALTKLAAARDQVDPAKEDAFEILVGPEDKDGKAAKLYRFLVNGNNVMADEVLTGTARAPTAAADRAWNSNWKVVAKELEQEGQWVMEAAIPWADLGVTPQPGQAVAFNVARHWALLKKGTDEWAWGTRPPVVDKSYRLFLDLEEQVSRGQLTLAADGPAVRVQKVGNLLNGQVDFAAVLFNPAAVEKKLNVTLKSNTGSLAQQKPVTLAAGGEATFAVAQLLEGASDSALTFEVRAVEADRLLARQVWNFVRKPSFDVAIQNFPSVGKLAVTMDCSFLQGVEPADLHAELALADAAGKLVLSQTTPNFSAYRTPVELATSKLSPGDYRLAVKILAGDKVVAEDKDRPYRKNPLPEWLGNPYGYDFKNVPAPFTPVKRDKTGATVWERRYEFGGRVLPTQVTALGMKILRAPVNLTLKLADGREIRTDMLPAKIKWSRKPAWTMTRWNKAGLPEAVQQPVSPDIRAEGVAVARAGDITIENRFWIEYDGLLWSDLRITSKTDLELTSAVLEVPITAEFSDVMNPPIDKIPAAGYALIHAPQVWVGNGYGGLQTLLVSKPKLWQGEIAKAGRVDPGPDGATVRITLLDGPTTLSQVTQPLSLTLQATPVKPRYPNYRRHVWYFEGCKTYFDIAGWYPPGQEFLPCPNNYYTPEYGLVRPYKMAGDVPREKWPANWQAGPLNYATVYVTSGGLNINSPEGQEFKDEWIRHDSPQDRVLPGTTIIGNTLCAKSCRDYFLWRHGQLMDRIPYAGLYYDTLDVGGDYDNNPYLKGTPGFMTGLLGGRDFARRMYTLVKTHFPDGIMFDHTVYNDLMLGKAFTDFQLEGEQLWPAYKPGLRNVKGIVTPDKYRAHYMGLNYGRVGCWDPKLGNQAHTTRAVQRQTGPSIAQHMQSLAMLHDSSFHLWAYSFPNEHTALLTNALLRCNWGEQYLMIPYWDQKIVELPANLYATFYVEPEAGGSKPKTVDSTGYFIQSLAGPAKRVIGIFANESDWKGEVRIKPDWAKLGFASLDGVTAENAVHRFKIKYLDPKALDTDDFLKPEQFALEDESAEYARIENGELLFPISDWNYRMIVLERK